jgi:hypothetical protein
MHDTSLEFVLALTAALADATADAMIRDPAEADSHSRVAFEAVWRVLAGTPAPSSVVNQNRKESI